MRRREFIAALGTATLWSIVARAQRAAPPVIGFLTLAPRRGTALETDAFLSV
jgi:hypothetical protein